MRRKQGYSLWNIKKNLSNKKFKHGGKNVTLWKIGHHIMNEATILASIEKKAKAVAFRTSRKIKVIKKSNTVEKMKHHGK